MKKHTNKTVGSHGNGNYSEAPNKATPKRGKQDVNLRKRGFLHFQIGLILAMFLVYMGLEVSFRTFKTHVAKVEEIVDLPFEYYPDLAKIKVEKPEQKVALSQKKVMDPTVFDIRDNDVSTDDLKEFINKPNEADAHLNPDDINYVEPRDTLEMEVPFRIIEDAPIFPGCENVSKGERKDCFNEMMQKHIKKYFRYPEPEMEMGIQGKVYVMFKINVDGTITNIRLKGPSKGLEKEAERIIENLPKMTPGKQRGKAVRVPFSIPINFRLQN